MIRKLEQKPLWLTGIILIGAYLVSYFSDNSLEVFIYLGAFTGTAAFANTLWLNRRINRIEDTLEGKGIVKSGDFIVDDITRRLVQRDFSKIDDRDISPERRKLEEKAQKISNKYSYRNEQSFEDVDFSDMSDEEINKFMSELKSQMRFEIGYNIFIWGILILIFFGISLLF